MVFLCAFGLALLAVLALTPAVRSLARRLRFLDYPKQNKVHKRPTPLLGGIAVALASLAAAAGALSLIRCPYSARLVGFMSGGLVVVVLGLADDANGMRPAAKLTGQTVAAIVMLVSGGVEGIPLQPAIAFPLAVLWMVGLMNAFNFLDNMDGITSGIAAIATFGIFTLALGNGHYVTAIAAISVAGGALGFLRFNFSPATIFLGDAGSLFLGYVVGGLSLRAVAYAEAGSVGLLAPVLMLGYPIFDAFLVTVARLREGRDVAQGGRDHSTHRMALLGLSAKQTATTIYLISGALTATAVYVSLYHRNAPALLALTTVAAACGMAMLGFRLLRVREQASRPVPAAAMSTGSVVAESIAPPAEAEGPETGVAGGGDTDSEAAVRIPRETIEIR